MKRNHYTLAFYNLENLFDTVDDPFTHDDDFTATSKKKWNKKRFNKKVKKLGRVISNIGYADILHPPVIVGVAEVENEAVIRALVESKFLKKKGYDFVHFDSPDERGIDTALIFRSKYFEILDQQVHGLQLTDDEGKPDYTRDVLHVHGILEKEPVHVLVNHWPSRRRGAKETEHKRLAASEKNKEVVRQIFEEDPNSRIILMGDFNDDPHSESIRRLIDPEFYNPMEQLLTRDTGSLSYKGAWNLFDQIIMSHNFLQQHNNSFRFQDAKIHNPADIQQFKGRFKGNPFRTFAGRRYLGGFSDHFPVYSIFSVE